MLKSLYIKNYALFAETRVEFTGGLNILTGETGAGKSLLVGALGLIMGKRADNSAVFYPDSKCIVEAEFGELSSRLQKSLARFEEFDFESDTLLIRREVNPNGKSRAFINDTPVSLQIVKVVSAQLFDLHGQHENQSLLQPEHQLELVDAYAHAGERVDSFKSGLAELRKTLAEIQVLEKKEAQAKTEQEYLLFQLKEMEEAGLQAGEEEGLEQEIKLLQNAESIKEVLNLASEELYQGELSVHNRLNEILTQLGKFKEVNKTLDEHTQNLLDASEVLQEASFAFNELLETVDSDAERLAFIEDRLAVYHNLKQKYKVRTPEALIEKFEDLKNKAEEFSSIEENISVLRKKAASQQSQLGKIGEELEKIRLARKPELETHINAMLKGVGFKDALLEIAVERLHHSDGILEVAGRKIKPVSNGINKVTFVIRTNPGLPPGALSQIASGGEISRVMLAIKSALADKSEFPVLIFDEIDTGISGEIANKVGAVMRKLATRYQILSITHLPQIAAKGDNHYLIEKFIKAGQTESSVRKLGQDERIHELAKMLSGDNPPNSAIQNAMELIK